MEIGSVADWVAAIGGIVALAGAVVAIRLQIQELRYQREELAAQRGALDAQREELSRNVQVQRDLANLNSQYGYYSHQLDLLKMAIEDPDLQLDVHSGRSTRDKKLRLHTQAWLRLVETGHSTGLLSDEDVKAALSTEVFSSRLARDFWVDVSPQWSLAMGGRLERFVKLANEALEIASDRLGNSEQP
ncbi:MAG: DUF6082 family protein [Actinomycetota bacterium]